MVVDISKVVYIKKGGKIKSRQTQVSALVMTLSDLALLQAEMQKPLLPT